MTKKVNVAFTEAFQSYYSAGDEAEPYCEECEMDALQDNFKYCPGCGGELVWEQTYTDERIPKGVKVEVLDGDSGAQLETLISGYLNDGYMIQDSQVEWHQGTILGVYVFIKED